MYCSSFYHLHSVLLKQFKSKNKIPNKNLCVFLYKIMSSGIQGKIPTSYFVHSFIKLSILPNPGTFPFAITQEDDLPVVINTLITKKLL